MYHPVTPWATDVARCFGFSWATIRVPGGANGVVLKKKVQIPVRMPTFFCSVVSCVGG
jgi:hypothetical protein